MENKNYFEVLNEINVNEKVEKKNGLSYLSWAYAWGEIKKKHPKANYKIYEKEDGRIYWDDGKTAWVKVSVTIDDIEHIEYLPIMDYNNRSILVDKITSFDVNKSIQRALTKAVARHGLGLYIYAGEDLPDEATENAPQEEKPQNKASKSKPVNNTSKVQKSQNELKNEAIKRVEENNFEDDNIEEVEIALLNSLKDNLFTRLDYISKEEHKELSTCLIKLCNQYGVNNIDELSVEQLQIINSQLEKRMCKLMQTGK